MASKISHKEDTLQCIVAILLDNMVKMGKVAVWFHIANEFVGNIFQGVLRKKKGVKKGIPDNYILLPNGQHFFIELKVENNKMSLEQEQYKKRFNNANIEVFVCRTPEEVKQVVLNFYRKDEKNCTN
ncbi:MAG: VRR-NUC domain-containing protein [Bacteroidales bacterium]|jgi:hypothetical protein|nr:VRR-NUC domain-containing protein [Bacteroidales bacterium]